jgi:hypothetical protein
VANEAQRAAETPEQTVERMRHALEFIKELATECLGNGDARIGTGAEIGFRHILRRANETL